LLFGQCIGRVGQSIKEIGLSPTFGHGEIEEGQNDPEFHVRFMHGAILEKFLCFIVKMPVSAT
jgi:hypothetical protein